LDQIDRSPFRRAGCGALAKEAAIKGSSRVAPNLALGVLVVLPAVVTLFAAELLLRLYPHLPPVDVGTAIYSVYGVQPGDIYYLDPPTRSFFMWPNYRVRAYWNGYLWDHRTDELGFRNPPGLRDRSVVWLGDSLIYGHGVEEHDTVVHMLRSQHGMPAYNAARQGDCLYQEYLVARLLLAKLQPRRLIVTVFLNDFEDLEKYRSAAEIAAPPELALDVSALEARLQQPQINTKWRAQLHRLKLWRLAETAVQRVSAWRVAAISAQGDMPEYLRPITDEARWAPIAGYYDMMLADLSRRAREAGAELVLLHLDVGDHVFPAAIPAQDRIRELLESIGRKHLIRVFNTRRIFDDCHGCFLPNDGHLSPAGHRHLADFVGEHLR
jgi:hypothetical protein